MHLPSQLDSVLTSLSLLERVKAEDEAASERFFHLYSPLVYQWAQHAGLQPADAADVTQDLFVKLSGKLHSFRKEAQGDSFRAWLRTVTKNLCRNMLRSRERHAHAEGGTAALLRMSEVQQPSEPAMPEHEQFDEEATLMQAALELISIEFSEHLWQAFKQTTMDGRKAADVAADLGMSIGSVYTAKSRVLARLRSEFEGLL